MQDYPTDCREFITTGLVAAPVADTGNVLPLLMLVLSHMPLLSTCSSGQTDGAHTLTAATPPAAAERFFPAMSVAAAKDSGLCLLEVA